MAWRQLGAKPLFEPMLVCFTDVFMRRHSASMFYSVQYSVLRNCNLWLIRWIDVILRICSKLSCYISCLYFSIRMHCISCRFRLKSYRGHKLVSFSFNECKWVVDFCVWHYMHQLIYACVCEFYICVRRMRYVTYFLIRFISFSLRRRHNAHNAVSNHQPHDCLLNHLFRRRSKNTSKIRVTGLCAGISPVTGEFAAQRTNNAENVSIWWCHLVYLHWYSSARILPHPMPLLFEIFEKPMPNACG